MTVLADNQPFVMYSLFLALWVAWSYGYYATGNDKEEAVEMWAIIYETTTFQIPTKGLNLDKFLDRVYGQERCLRFD